MTAGDRLRGALASIQWSQRQLAAMLQRDERQVRRWASGASYMPGDVLAWLEDLAACHRAMPPPKRRERDACNAPKD